MSASYANGTPVTDRREQDPMGTKDGEGKPRAKTQYSQSHMGQGKERNAGKQGTDHHKASTSRKAEFGAGSERWSSRQQELHAYGEYVEKKKKVAPNQGGERVNQHMPYEMPITSEGIALKTTDVGPGRRRHAIGKERMEEWEVDPADDTEGDHLMPEVMEVDGREGSQSRAGEANGRSAVVQGITVLLGSGDRRAQRSAYVKTSKSPVGARMSSSEYPPQLVQGGLVSAAFTPSSVQQTSPPGKHEATVARVKRCLLLADREGKELEGDERQLQVVLASNKEKEATGAMDLELARANENSTGVWNCRGARKKEALDRCRVLIRDHKLDVLVLLETLGRHSGPLEQRAREKRCSGVAALGPKGKAFARFVDESGLCDLGYEGIPYTWCNNQQGARRIWIRLNRALANTAWVSEHPECKVQHLDRGASDHAPLLLTVPAGTTRSKRPFRFELLWMEYEECQNVIQETWKRQANGNPMQAFSHRLSELRRSLSNWNRAAVGNVERRIKVTNLKLADLEELDANGLLSEEGMQSLRSFYNCKIALNRQLNIKWLQRSRLRWTEDGDRNTKFFHLSATMRRRRNSIAGILGEDGCWIQESAEVSSCFTAFYQRLWGEADAVDPGSQAWPSLPSISPEEASLLQRPVTEEEIKEVVWSLPKVKAPGPDGMQAEVYTKYWDTMGGDLCRAVGHFFNSASMPKAWGDTFITLIPKKEHPVKVADYRPIALCNVSYKVIAKIMANRLKAVLAKIIGPEQAAFVAGRSIEDNTLAAQEVAHSMATDKSGQPIMMIKMDMEKAYDRVSWSAVVEVLRRMGFPTRWCNWVQACIASPRFALLINGSPTTWITPRSGLRQGDPISPYLFIIVTQVLLGLINEKAAQGLLRGFRVREVQLSHLLYADDLLFMLEATPANAYSILESLSQYERLTNQRVNYSKSELYLSRRVGAEEGCHLSALLGLKEAGMPFKYLGVLISGRRVKVQEQQELVERISKRLAGWKGTLLSQVGKLTLIKAALLAIPSYWLGSTWVPNGVLEEIEKKARNFLWKNQDGHGLHLMNWAQVTLAKRQGGLGVRRLREARTAHLGKLVFKFLNREQAPWIQLMQAKYGRLHPWETSKSLQPSWMWRALTKTANQIRMGCRVLIGNGTGTSAAFDSWLHEIPWSRQPRVLAPRLMDETLSVANLTRDGQWTPVQLAREAGSELAFEITNFSMGAAASEDRWIWWPHPRGTPSVKAIYQSLLPQSAQLWAGWSNLWRLQVSPRIRVFCWKLLWGRLLTRAYLHYLHIGPEDRCAMCGLFSETSEHLLFSCRYSREVWAILGTRERLVAADIDQDWITKEWGAGAEEDGRAKGLIACTLWSLWKSRNGVVFREKRTPELVVVRAAVQMAEEYRCVIKRKTPKLRMTRKPWEPPEPGWIKANTDGALRAGAYQGGATAIFRNAEGEFLQAGWEPCPGTSALHSELWAIRLALRMARGGPRLQVESDCTEAISYMQQPERSPWRVRNLARECAKLANSFGEVRLSHVGREANAVADWAAAKASLASGYCHVERLNNAPPEICNLLAVDADTWRQNYNLS
ncbi:uncharacterized protein [Typha angustifolia]|uniref:uncharacterized protein n=1 Tax=Typha angustifolia TaxID=59011 RepID=UPI003C2FAF7F